jgi:hypothetical protein
MGLDTLDEFSPKDTDPVSLGDDAIRATRAATKQSVGVEHYLDGPHKLPGGTLAARPAAGRAGRVYYNTDLKSMEYDNGSAWVSPADAKATACILWHSAQVAIASGATRFEIPFDYVIDDPGGYGYPQYHQIIQPPNSIGMVSAYLEFVGPIGGLGLVLAIEQYDNGSAAWRPLVQYWANNQNFMSVNTIVDSRWGLDLRVTVTNGSQSVMNVNPTALGASPRFGYVMMGRTS